MKREELKTPCYVIQKEKIVKNLEKLKFVSDKTGCKILLAQKAFSMFYLYPLISKYLDGTTASGLFEARLGYEEMPNREVHCYSPAYKEGEIDEIIKYSDHIVFNSVSQIKKYGLRAKNKGKSIGLRINPECSTQDKAIYDPCAEGSRLGTTIDKIDDDIFDFIDGIHFHTLCEQNSDALKITLDFVIEKFGKYFNKIKWINFGGGHHITREDYDIETLIGCIKKIQNDYNLEVYIEPGEAIALNAGVLLTRVLDIVQNKINIAILDASASCHMPDVIEMPYRPPLKNSGVKDEFKYNYRLSSATCLAGDIIGDYSFINPLKEGDILEFQDMAIYSMVKNNTFNGMKLPDIVLEENNSYKVIKSFGYEDFKNRLS